MMQSHSHGNLPLEDLKLDDERTDSSNQLQNLPDAITECIISKLPFTDLIPCSLINKSFAKIITKDQAFAFNHFCHASKETDPCLFIFYERELRFSEINSDGNPIINEFKTISPMYTLGVNSVIASCNGYLCFCFINPGYSRPDWSYLKPLRNPFFVLNPFTGHSLWLPRLEMEAELWALGFGFHPVTKDYKIVLVHVCQVDLQPEGPALYQPELDVRVFTLGSEQWRSVEAPVTLTTHRVESKNLKSVCMDGSIHWLSKPTGRHDYYVIVLFNLATEKFEEVELPDRMACQRCIQLLVVKGNLAVVILSAYDQLEIWVMKDYKVKKSWHVEFTIQNFKQKVGNRMARTFNCRGRLMRRLVNSATGNPSVICVFRNGRILMRLHPFFMMSYDMSTDNFVDFRVQGIPYLSYYQTFFHYGSLIRINAETTEL